MATFVRKKIKVKRTRVAEDGQIYAEMVPPPLSMPSTNVETQIPEVPEIPEVPAVPEPTFDPVGQDGTVPHFNVSGKDTFWDDIKGPMMTMFATMSGPPGAEQTCGTCNEESATVTCTDCGLMEYQCVLCATRIHQNKLHKPQEWVDGYPRDLLATVICHRVAHQCVAVYSKNLDVFDEKGRHHNVAVRLCSCEPEASTLLRYRLWSPTPNPRRAVHLDLLKTIHFSIMECKTSLHSICQMLRWRNGLSAFHTNSLYRDLVSGSLEKWEGLYTAVIQDAVPHADGGTTCPACPKKDGIVHVALDGNFGLVHRKKAGKSEKPPQPGFFVEDEVVQPFVEGYNKDKQRESEDCSQFQAGQLVRSKKKNAALDVKGVFAAVCKHGFPLAAMNLYHGERLAYPVAMITHLLENLGGPSDRPNIHVIYDIGCMLHAHLERTNQKELLSSIQLSVPAFHAYGHKGSCQIKFGIRNQKDAGLCDGEGVERLWAYLRRFAAMTKEMAPTKRMDTLNRALVHFSQKKQEMIGGLLCKTMRHAEKTFKKCEKEVKQICEDYAITETAIDTWANELHNFSEIIDLPDTINETYVKMLRKHRELLEAREDGTAANRIARSERKLTRFEKRQGWQRWLETDVLYISTTSALSRKQEVKALKVLRRAVAERTYVKELLKKYSVGQAVAIRLSKEMTARTKAVKKALRDYNALATNDLEFEEAANPEAAVYSSLLTNFQGTVTVPQGVKHSAVNSQTRRERAKEEIVNTKEDMKRALQWQEYQIDVNKKEVGSRMESKSQRDLGVCALILDRVNKQERQHKNCRELFGKYIDV